LQEEINTVENSNGVLLIPAFSIERSQEIIHRISLLKKAQKILPQTPVFLDSPMAIEVMDIFKKYPNLYNKVVAKEKHPFDFENLILTKSAEDSKKILETKGVKVIIAGSGMLSGGRILHHLVNYISNPSTRLLFVGYQAENTLGRLIQDGAKQIVVYHQKLYVNATISKISSLSSHADAPKLLKWLGAIHNETTLFLTHGEDPQRIALQEKIQRALGIAHIYLPKKGETYEIN
jgi:metallo-beta-lactamase family protein